ncbi:MAG: antibiotic biosynthesis monooxygenase [Chroococcidiopsidaceae cyanobacterium CP_BM_RX_35]|nr:antibiotic biosynthesis monooxygenase [Chroococcidiopsidaceae cyanobacterium CP_BM_RX_35]
MPVVLINPFVVPADKEEEFLRAWNETTRVFSNTPGFIETHLHKNRLCRQRALPVHQHRPLGECGRMELHP